jgi:hypothetical protein
LLDVSLLGLLVDEGDQQHKTHQHEFSFRGRRQRR